MRWLRVLLLIAPLVLGWAALAAWQYHEYNQAVDAARQTLRGQADSLMKALVGGIRYHRRFGPWFPEQLREQLRALAPADDVLAVAIAPEGGPPAAIEGREGLVDPAAAIEPGESWDAAGLRYAASFQLEPEPGGGFGPGGLGRGGGRGWGRGAAGEEATGPRGAASPFIPGARLVAMLVLDRSEVDAAVRREARLRTTIAAGGAVLLGCLALAWLATLRLTEMKGRTRLLEIQARHLEELNQAAAGLAHETRGPLGLVRGWAQRLAESETGLRSERLAAMVEECDRITVRINQFLTFARPRRPSPQAVDLAGILNELAALLEPDLEARRVQLVRCGEGSPASMRADRELLRQALFNLLVNAIHAAPADTAVEVAVRTVHNGRWRIEIADRGAGVPAENVNRLFTPYFTTRTDGAGLGLAIVRRIAADHGWQCGYTPRPGGGAVFYLDAIDG